MSPEAPVQTVLVCSQCGRSFAHSDLVQIAGNWVCADCKPLFLSRVMASGAAQGSLLAWRYGGFWIRFAARFIDGLIFMVPAMIFYVVWEANLIHAAMHAGNRPPAFNPSFFTVGILTFSLISFLAACCYEVLMLKYYSATLGKMACGLKVVRPDGGRLGWGVCFGRFFMWNFVTCGIPLLNSALMPISCIMVGVDIEKRALHDRVCDTRVIYKQSVA